MGLKHSRDDIALPLPQHALSDVRRYPVPFSRHDSQRQPVRRQKRLTAAEKTDNQQQNRPPSRDDVSSRCENVTEAGIPVVQNDSLVKPETAPPVGEFLVLPEPRWLTSDVTDSNTRVQPTANLVTQQMHHVIGEDESKQHHYSDRIGTHLVLPPPLHVRRSRPLSLTSSAQTRPNSATFDRLPPRPLSLRERYIRTSVYSFSSASGVSDFDSTQRIRSILSLADSQQYLADISSGDSNNASDKNLAKLLPLQPSTRDNMTSESSDRISSDPVYDYRFSSFLSQETLRHHVPAANKHVSTEDSSTSDQAIDIKDMPPTSVNTKHQPSGKLQDKLKELKSSALTASSSAAAASAAAEQTHLATLTESALTGDVMDKHGLNDLSDPASSTSHSTPCNIDSSEFSL